MSSNNNDDSYNENVCVVCFKNVDIFSIGDCDHPVCYECSTRMRVLCRQNECPICRHDMQKVIFTTRTQPFKKLERGVDCKHLLDRKFKIVFENTDVQHAYNTLLAHVCSKCPGRHAFQTFNHLKDHMRKDHELFYCDLCVENLKILTHERRSYTRKELATHRRHGDPDDRSHRGHPLCEFCDRRYMDNDELYRHLRKDHLFCHFCDADGLHHYYDDYDVLRNHFRDHHYLCEEGDCYDEKFTSAFRTEIDLKAHRASVHGRQMTKAAAKQARTLDLTFTLKPRQRQADQRRGGRPNSRYNYSDEEEEGAVGGMAVDFHRSSQPTSAPSFAKLNTASNDEFPSLGGSSAPSTQQGVQFRKPGVTIRAGGSLAMTKEDFPALGPETTASVSLRVNSVSAAERTKGAKPTNLSIHVNHRPGGVVASVSSTNSSQSLSKDAFPALSNKSTPPSAQWKSARESEPKFTVKTKPNQPVHKPSQPKASKSYHYEDDDFPSQNNYPSLSSNIPHHIASLAANQWCSSKEPESKFSINKSKPSQPPPKPPQPKTFHIEDDFPSLNSRFDASCSFNPEINPAATHVRKESSISIPVDNNWTKIIKGPTCSDNVSSDSDLGTKKGTKKKKNKSKTKKETMPEPNKPIPAKCANNESNKKNKQKEESQSKNKQIKVETQKTTESNSGTQSVKKNPEKNVERKRSELKIEGLNGQSEPDNEISFNDFPSLGNTRLPPGFTSMPQAPPGFEIPSAPPPGFSITLNSVARPPSNGLTFTSSSGQNYPINNTGDSVGTTRVFSYAPPINIKNRNAELVSRVKSALGSPSALEEFLQMSSLFRQGSLVAESYYNHCRDAMGDDTFRCIFPELLALLPDIPKQQDLWKVAEKDAKCKLMECAACGQVVTTADFRHHQATHSLENHFPTLSNGVSGPNAWTNK